jgi:hypothetical protein
MTYCRWTADSDVYLYRSTRGIYICCDCSVARAGVSMFTPEDVLVHLQVHRDHGERVPESAFDRIRVESERGELEEATSDFSRKDH